MRSARLFSMISALAAALVALVLAGPSASATVSGVTQSGDAVPHADQTKIKCSENIRFGHRGMAGVVCVGEVRPSFFRVSSAVANPGPRTQAVTFDLFAVGTGGTTPLGRCDFDLPPKKIAVCHTGDFSKGYPVAGVARVSVRGDTLTTIVSPILTR